MKDRHGNQSNKKVDEKVAERYGSGVEDLVLNISEQFCDNNSGGKIN